MIVQRTLSVFALVNVALIFLKVRGTPAPEGTFQVPLAVPMVGFVASLAKPFRKSDLAAVVKRVLPEAEMPLGENTAAEPSNDEKRMG